MRRSRAVKIHKSIFTRRLRYCKFSGIFYTYFLKTERSTEVSVKRGSDLTATRNGSAFQQIRFTCNFVIM